MKKTTVGAEKIVNSEKSEKFVALLRGINVGGHIVPMAVLKKTLASIGCGNVQTILASENIVFEKQSDDSASLADRIEKTLTNEFGFPIPVLLRHGSHIAKLVQSEPFKEITVTPKTRLYVTFLGVMPKKNIVPKLPSKDYQILRVIDGAVCSVVRLSQNAGTLDYMATIEKELW